MLSEQAVSQVFAINLQLTLTIDRNCFPAKLTLARILSWSKLQKPEQFQELKDSADAADPSKKAWTGISSKMYECGLYMIQCKYMESELQLTPMCSITQTS